MKQIFRYIILMTFAAMMVTTSATSSLLLVSSHVDVPQNTSDKKEYKIYELKLDLFSSIQQKENRVLSQSVASNGKYLGKSNVFGTEIAEQTIISATKQYYVTSKKIIASLPTLDLLYPYHHFL